MERWVKILLGTIFSTIGCAVFFIIYDRIMVYFRNRRHQRNSSSSGEVMTMQKMFKKSKGEEMENLVYEQFDSTKHEVLVVCLESDKRVAAICLYLADREIEWYMENLPECCVTHSDDRDISYRNLMTTVGLWSPKWTYAESVNLLTKDVEVVRNIGKRTTRQWRAVFMHEQKHFYKMFVQWSENYICDEVANEELWEETLASTQRLLTEGDSADLWTDLPVGHWRRKRVRPAAEHFHLVPHPGEITPVEACDDVGPVHVTTVSDTNKEITGASRARDSGVNNLTDSPRQRLNNSTTSDSPDRSPRSRLNNNNNMMDNPEFGQRLKLRGSSHQSGDETKEVFDLVEL